jgi:hypothetical protein
MAGFRIPATKSVDVDCTYALATFEIHSNQLRLKKVICDGLDDKTSAMFYWKRPPKADGTQMVVDWVGVKIIHCFRIGWSPSPLKALFYVQICLLNN